MSEEAGGGGSSQRSGRGPANVTEAVASNLYNYLKQGVPPPGGRERPAPLHPLLGDGPTPLQSTADRIQSASGSGVKK